MRRSGLLHPGPPLCQQVVQERLILDARQGIQLTLTQLLKLEEI